MRPAACAEPGSQAGDRFDHRIHDSVIGHQVSVIGTDAEDTLSRVSPRFNPRIQQKDVAAATQEGKHPVRFPLVSFADLIGESIQLRRQPPTSGAFSAFRWIRRSSRRMTSQ